MNRRAIIVAAILVLILLGAGAWLSMGRLPQAQLSTPTINNVEYDVRVEISDQLTTGEEGIVRIRVAKGGKPFDVNQEGRLLHVMIVSANLRDAFHTYTPTKEAPGVYSVQHIFTESGQYRIWTEVDDATAATRHDQNAEQIAYTEVAISGSPLTTSSLVEKSEAVVGNYQIRLITSPIEAGKPTTLRVAVTDTAGKSMPLFEHEPFLYFMSGENFSFFRHGHGVTLSDGSAGLENVFPKAGKYVWWLNLHLIKGEVVEEVQVPFIITVS